MKKIGIATVFTGYNYGSALQAYATGRILANMGYESELLKLRGSLLPGRDIRLKKLLSIFFRSLIHAGGIKSLKNYRESVSKELPEGAKELFCSFYDDKLKPRVISYGALRKAAKQDAYAAFVCGSDQIWNSAVFYVDPFYYLRFAPVKKRIAFAPSFGRDYVPDYNRKKITRYISDITHKSIREVSGAEVIKQLTGEDVPVLLDPTLVLCAEEWMRSLQITENRSEKYIVAYFLDKPSDKTVEIVRKIGEKYCCEIKSLPYLWEKDPFGKALVTGPAEFVELIRNASFVCTDSFHGTAFALNFNIPFYTFERNYGNAGKQSARIESILQLTDQRERYEPIDIEGCMNMSFDRVNQILNAERMKSLEYLKIALDDGE